MTKLEELTLRHNDHLFLDKGVFDNLVSLRVLDLSHTRLQITQQKLFTNLVSLRTLHLDYTLLADWHLDGDEFINCRHLETFTAVSSGIISLPEKGDLFRKNKKLREVDLSQNSLSYIHVNEFSYSWELESLNISHNKILAFYPQHQALLLRAPQRLRVLDMSNNELRTFPMDLLTQLSSRQTTVGLYNNWNLHCSAMFLFRFTDYLSSTSNDVLRPDLIKCGHPEHLTNQTIGNFNCPEGGEFKICSTPAAPSCEDKIRYQTAEPHSQCVPRCTCPEDKPIDINGVCSDPEACSYLDIGPCFKERAISLHGRSRDVYTPSCDEEGRFLPLQCRFDGKCWCTDPLGKDRCPMFRIRDVERDVCSQRLDPMLELLPEDYPPDSDCALEQLKPQSPFKTCAIWGNGRVKQYDGTTFRVAANCYYDLFSDYSRHAKYHLYVRFTDCGPTRPFCITMLQLFIHRVHLVRVSLEFDVFYNNKIIHMEENSELELLGGKVLIKRKRDTLAMEMKYLTIEYSAHNYLILTADTNVLSNVAGACGTTNPNNIHLSGHQLFNQKKLIRNCGDSVEMMDEETGGGGEVVGHCQDLMQDDMGVKTTIPRFVAKQVVRGCEVDSRVMSEKDVKCGSRAALRSYGDQPSMDIDDTCI